MSTLLLPYRLGDPTDIECHYPVIVSPDTTDLVLGHVFRFHRPWYAVPNGKEEYCVGRPDKGQPGHAKAADHLIKEYVDGNITPIPLTELVPRVFEPLDEVPLLHPRLPATDRNIGSAKQAFATIEAQFWRARSGFPGSDNHWWLECILPGCPGWSGPRYLSHIRGRNGEPPSTYRHPGCLPPEQVRKLIAAYQQ
ncbi:hypothetical protein [Kitasatospora sp. NPDC085464]|uniref:hypothetical protein n=1 Tax=Kitasatospora sp. NPDC085464 TaxID=3364063 RepID=UPI0037C64A01